MTPDLCDYEDGVVAAAILAAVKAEREACAKIADAAAPPPTGGVDTRNIWRGSAARAIATAIRARSAPTDAP